MMKGYCGAKVGLAGYISEVFFDLFLSVFFNMKYVLGPLQKLQMCQSLRLGLGSIMIITSLVKNGIN